MQETIVEKMAQQLATLVARTGDLRFTEVRDERDWSEVCAMRKRCYAASRPYLLDVVDDDGKDCYDRHSFVYAAFAGDRALATIRATTYPFETTSYVPEASLAEFLGPEWQSQYLEWGRLVVDRNARNPRLTHALITYAGFRLLGLTRYRSYFGYARPGVKKLVSRFLPPQDTVEFQIPSRGPHRYLLVKGSFGWTALGEMTRWAREAELSIGLLPAQLQRAL